MENIQNAQKSLQHNPPVRQEECRLSAAGTFIRVREVVPTADEACTSGTNIMAREVGVNERGAFCGLCVVGVSAVFPGGPMR
jgi:hypothetical protein